MNYNANGPLKNGHFNTIYSSFARKTPRVRYQRESLLVEGGHLDLDWSAPHQSKELILLSHGLEGNTNAKYILGMVSYFNQMGIDALAWNYGSCTPNSHEVQNRFYHSGHSEDLYVIQDHLLKNHQYESVYLIGFSMGGNIILKFLGEQEHTVHPLFKKAVVFSVPCDLASTAMTLKTGFNMVYTLNFLRTLKQKVKQRENYLRKKGIDTHKVLKVKNLNEFDEAFTAPYYGFKSAVDYYEQVSAKRFLSGIKKPTLIVNALDDPFLTKECFPHQELENHPYVSLETPSFGGHVGFYTKDPRNVFWTEKRAYNFIQDKSVK